MLEQTSVGGVQRHASILRCTVLGIWCAILIATPYEAYAALPAELAAGYGVGAVALGVDVVRSVLLSESALTWLRWSGVFGCVLAAFCPHWGKWPALLALVSVGALDTVTRAYSGFVNHAQLLPLVLLLLLTVTPSNAYVPLVTIATVRWRHADRLKVSSRCEMSECAAFLWMSTVLVLVAYSYVGLNRVWQGGTQIFLGGAIVDYVSTVGQYYSAYSAWRVSMDGLPEAARAVIAGGFVLTTALEVSSALVLVSERFRYVWVSWMMGFHVATVPTMGLLFWENSILIVVLLAPPGPLPWRGYR